MNTMNERTENGGENDIGKGRGGGRVWISGRIRCRRRYQVGNRRGSHCGGRGSGEGTLQEGGEESGGEESCQKSTGQKDRCKESPCEESRRQKSSSEESPYEESRRQKSSSEESRGEKDEEVRQVNCSAAAGYAAPAMDRGFSLSA